MSSKEMKDACPNYEMNMKRCTCDYEPCSRKGLCCQCIAYHNANGGKPACMK